MFEGKFERKKVICYCNKNENVIKYKHTEFTSVPPLYFFIIILLLRLMRTCINYRHSALLHKASQNGSTEFLKLFSSNIRENRYISPDR